LALLLAGCGAYTASASQVVEGYESALAEGSYSSACHNFLTAHAKTLLIRKARAKNCAAAIAHCLPNDALNPKKDQSQLFYANVATSGHGSGTTVSINGNPVANAIRHVSLAPKPGGWILTSYGEGFTGCQPHPHNRRGRRH
jgi:hypothetical protein